MSFLAKHFKKALLAIALVGAVAAGAGTVSAQMTDGRMIPNNLWRQITTTAIAPISTTLELGSSSIRIAKGWFTALDATTITVGTFTTGLTQNSVVFVGAAGVLSEDTTNFIWDDTNNRLGIGTNAPSYPLHIAAGSTTASEAGLYVNRTSVGSGSEVVAQFAVSDDATSYFRIVNNTSTDAVFAASLQGLSTSTSQFGIEFVGIAQTDTGSTGVTAFRSQTAAGTAIATRPAFVWRNFSTEMMQLDALGRLRMNTAAAYSTTGLTSQGVLYYGATGGILTLAAYSSSGNTQFNLNTAVGSGTNATRFSIGSTGLMTLTPVQSNGALTIFAASTITSNQFIASQITDATTTSGSVALESMQYIANPSSASSGAHYAAIAQAGTASANAQNFTSSPGLFSYVGAIQHRGSGTVTGAVGFYANGAGNSGGGTITNYYGFYVAANTTATNNYGFYNAGATNNVLGTGLTGIGVSPTASAGQLQVSAQAVASTAEIIAAFKVSDDAVGKVEIMNSTSTDSTFAPLLRSTGPGTSTALQITSLVTTDSGSLPALYINGATTGFGAIVTRPLAQFLNDDVVKWEIAANGGITSTITAAASAAETLHTWKVSDDATSLISIDNATTVDANFIPRLNFVQSGASANFITFQGTTDSGATAVGIINVKIGAATAVTTRPMLQIQNNSTGKWIMSANGAITQAVTSAASTAETLHIWSVSDDATGKFEILNNSATDATFVPLLRGTSASTNIGLVVRGASTTDTGTTAVSFYDSRIGTATGVATRKAFLWANNGSEVMNILGSTAGNALSTLGGRIKSVRSVSSTTITVAVTDHIVLSSTGGGAVAVSLPASPETGREYIIKDNVGDAGTNNITITPAAGNIDGAGTVVINANYGWRVLVYNGTQWNVTGRE